MMLVPAPGRLRPQWRPAVPALRAHRRHERPAPASFGGAAARADDGPGHRPLRSASWSMSPSRRSRRRSMIRPRRSWPSTSSTTCWRSSAPGGSTSATIAMPMAACASWSTGRAWEDYVSLAVDEIRHFGVEQLQVMRRLRAMFEDLQRVVPDERKAAISRELALLAKAVTRTFPDARIRSARASPTSKASDRHRDRPPGRAADRRAVAGSRRRPPGFAVLTRWLPWRSPGGTRGGCASSAR